MSDRIIRVVFGYLPDIDQENTRATLRGVWHRFALVLDTYRPDKPDMSFDSDLLLALLRGVTTLIPHCELRIAMDVDGQDIVSSFDALERRYSALAEEDQEPFYWLEYRDLTRVVGYIESEWYTLSGGPHPYHDSYTFSFYLQRYDRRLIQRQVLEVCEQVGAHVDELRSGVELPHRSRWSRLARLLHLSS